VQSPEPARGRNTASQGILIGSIMSVIWLTPALDVVLNPELSAAD
jgi:hypothetical protein